MIADLRTDLNGAALTLDGLDGSSINFFAGDACTVQLRPAAAQDGALFTTMNSASTPMFRIEEAGQVGFYGVNPVAQQTLGPTPTGAEIRAVLVAYGLITA